MQTNARPMGGSRRSSGVPSLGAEGALVDAVGGEAEAHEEEEGQEPGGEHGRIGQMDLVRAAGRHEIVDGGDAHHVKEAAAKGVAVGSSLSLRVETALGQSLVTERAVAPTVFRNFLTAKRTLSNGHAPLSSCVQNGARRIQPV